MKKLIQWWFQRFFLCVLSIACVIGIICTGPQVAIHEVLSVEIIEQSAEVSKVTEETHKIIVGTTIYEYELELVYYTSEDAYYKTFVVESNYPIATGDLVTVKYYKNSPNTVISMIDGNEYQPQDVEFIGIIFSVTLFIGIPIGVYTIYFLKKKKKPKVQKKVKSTNVKS